MDNWILEETIENLKNLKQNCESFMELCEAQKKLYKDKFNTDDKYEACSYEYWNACKIRTSYQIRDIEGILSDINSMMNEEVTALEEAYEDIRQKKADSYI